MNRHETFEELNVYARDIFGCEDVQVLFGRTDGKYCAWVGKPSFGKSNIWINSKKVDTCPINCLKALVTHELGHIINKHKIIGLKSSNEWEAHITALEICKDSEIASHLLIIWNSWKTCDWRSQRIYRLVYKKHNEEFQRKFIDLYSL